MHSWGCKPKPAELIPPKTFTRDGGGAGEAGAEAVPRNLFRCQAGGGEPGGKGALGACARVPASGDGDLASFGFLIGFAAPEGDDQPVGGFERIFRIEGHQLRAPEGAGESEQQNRPVSQPNQIVGPGGQRGFALLHSPFRFTGLG